MIVKYEDLVQDSKAMAVELYNFMNASKSLKHAFNYLESHMTSVTQQNSAGHKLTKEALRMSLAKRKIRLEAKWRTGQLSRLAFEKAASSQNDSAVLPNDNEELERERRLQKYYGTYRPNNFAHDHWRREISPEVLRDIHSNIKCQKVLKRLSYEL